MTKASELIRQSLILANVIDPMEEVVDGFGGQGLWCLNSILDQWSDIEVNIPTYKNKTITLSANLYQYTVTPIITEILQANIVDANNIQYLMRVIDLKEQNTLNYVLGQQNQSRPRTIFLQNALNTIQTSSQLFFFPVPDATYTVNLYVKQRLTNLAYSDDITEMRGAYFKFLQYELANDLSIVYQTVLSDKFKEKYIILKNEFQAANGKDLSVINSNPLNTYRRFRPWGTYVG